MIATCVRRGQLTAEQAQTIGSEFESFRQERLALIEPRASDFLQARQWLECCLHLPLRSGDALHLHLALAKRQHSPWWARTVPLLAALRAWAYP